MELLQTLQDLAALGQGEGAAAGADLDGGPFHLEHLRIGGRWVFTNFPQVGFGSECIVPKAPILSRGVRIPL